MIYFLIKLQFLFLVTYFVSSIKQFILITVANPHDSIMKAIIVLILLIIIYHSPSFNHKFCKVGTTKLAGVLLTRY